VKIIKFEHNKKYFTIAAYSLVTAVVGILIAAIIFNYKSVLYFCNEILIAISPVIWGLSIAFILNPLMLKIESKLKFIEKKRPHRNLKRCISIFISFVIVVGFLTILLISAIPQLITSIQQILNNISSYLDTLQKFAEKHLSDNKILDEWGIDFEKIKDYVYDEVQNFRPYFEDFLVKMRDGTIAFAVGIKNFLIGCIVAIYLLFSKETLLAQFKKTIIAIFPTNAHYTILYVLSKTNNTFKKFLASNILDSILVAMVNFIAMRIFDMPYAVLISFIIGITNMIPFFGPFIGAIPSVFLIFVENPKQALIYAIIILAIQQFDGNILAPKLFGDSLGLPTFWILFAIFLGGGLFGFIGMVAFIPLFAVIYTLLKEYVTIKLQKKGLPTSTTEYYEKAPEPPTKLYNKAELEITSEKDDDTKLF
jgi:predicted PurR-regulated permease PerM